MKRNSSPSTARCIANMSFYNIKPASAVRSDMIPNSAVQEVVDFLSAKIDEAARMGYGEYAVTQSTYLEFYGACSAMKGLNDGAKMATYIKVREEFEKHGYVVTMFTANIIIKLSWAQK